MSFELKNIQMMHYVSVSLTFKQGIQDKAIKSFPPHLLGGF